jgi:hypothetical protein
MDGGEWLDPYSSYHIHGATLRGRMGPRAGLDGVTNTKSLSVGNGTLSMKPYKPLALLAEVSRL